MKGIKLFLAMAIVAHGSFASEAAQKTINTKINSVIIFTKGAQINRKAVASVNAGRTILKFSGLSPYIDAQSIQVKTTAPITILSVNHQFDYLNKKERSEAGLKLETAIKALEEKLTLEHTRLDILADKSKFLDLNGKIGGNNNTLQVAQLQQAYDYYTKQITEIKLDEIDHHKLIEQYEKEKATMEDQLKSLNEHQELPSCEILVTLESDRMQQADFEVSYMVKNAGWHPSYDLRVDDIEKPMTLVYKANIFQNTNVDWENVHLTITSAEPDRSNVSPKLKPYMLGYNMLPPSYKSFSQVTGTVKDETGEPVPGVNVVVKGTTIGTFTDINGNYSITMPNGSQALTFSSVGYQMQDVLVNNPVTNVQLVPDVSQLQEVVVTAFGVSRGDDLQGKVPGMSIKKEGQTRVKGASSLPIDIATTENHTVVEFQIKNTYTIPSGDKSITVEMTTDPIPAYYEYYAVPKVERAAFLMAKVLDWEQYNLLDGEANIIFEGTYIGKTLLDTHNISDTLNISLGRDKGIVIERKQEKQFTSRKFIGSRKEESVAWKINVRNNKKQSINMVLVDQVPVSTNQDIEVQINEISGAERNADNGQLQWKFVLEPGNQKSFDLGYSIKYPKYQHLYIE